MNLQTGNCFSGGKNRNKYKTYLSRKLNIIQVNRWTYVLMFSAELSCNNMSTSLTDKSVLQTDNSPLISAKPGKPPWYTTKISSIRQQCIQLPPRDAHGYPDIWINPDNNPDNKLSI